MLDQHPESIAPPNILRVAVETRSPHRLRTAVVAIVAATATLFAGAAVVEKFGPGDLFPDLGLGAPDLPKLNSPPAKVEASIAKDTYSVEPFNVTIKGRIKVGVGVVSEKKDLTATANVDKMFFGDFLAGANTQASKANVSVHRLGDKVIDVSLDTPGLSNIQPRVDFTDPDNCLDIKSHDSIKEINQKRSENQKAINEGKNPSCDPVVKFGGLAHGFLAVGRSDKLLEVVKPTYTAAQIVIGAAGSVTQAANEFNVSYASDLKTELQQEYPGANVTVSINNTKTVDQQIDGVINELQKNQFDVTRVMDSKNPTVVTQLRIKSSDGSTIVANLDTPPNNVEPIRLSSFTKASTPAPAFTGRN